MAYRTSTQRSSRGAVSRCPGVGGGGGKGASEILFVSADFDNCPVSKIKLKRLYLCLFLSPTELVAYFEISAFRPRSKR